MSAVAVVPQDKAGLSGLVARKAPHGGVQDDDPDADSAPRWPKPPTPRRRRQRRPLRA